MLSLFLSLFLLPQKADLDVVYSRVAGEELKMDIHYPLDSAASPRPAVLVIHGGAWMAGKRTDMTEFAKYAASQGFVAATVTYRLAPKHKWPAMLDDVQTAVRFLRSNATKYGIDPNRIGSAGASAGGHLALYLGTSETRATDVKEFPGLSSRVAAVFDVFGPTDMTLVSDYPMGGLYDGMFQMVVGKPRKDAAAEIRAASPFFLVDKGDAPVFILHGTADPLVPVNQSRILEKRLKELGIEVQAVYVEGMAHELPVQKPEVKKAFEQGVAWMKRHLTPPEHGGVFKKTGG